jgi:Glycosyltransferase family 87
MTIGSMAMAPRTLRGVRERATYRWHQISLARLSDALNHPAVLPGLLVAGAVYAVVQGLAAQSGSPYAVYDAHVYWLAAGSEHPYAATIASGFDDTVNPFKYRYPPPLIQVLGPLHALPWPVFAALWTALIYLVFVTLAGRWALLLLLTPPVLEELLLGNVNLLIALAIVAGFRRPWAWSFVVLTKVSPGVGLLWFAVRREWRQLAIAILATACLGAVSFLLAPALWSEFVVAMRVQVSGLPSTAPMNIQIPVVLRLLVASGIVVVGARASKPWVVPVAAAIAAPAIWANVLAILVAVIPLLEGRGLDRPILPSIADRTIVAVRRRTDRG